MRHSTDLVRILPLFRRRVFGLLSKYPTLDREEVLNECTVRFVEKWDRYYDPTRGNPEQFTHLVAPQIFVDTIHSLSRLFPDDGDENDTLPSHYNRLAARDLIHKLLPQLNTRERAVLGLMGLNISINDIAQQLNLTRMQVRGTIKRIRQYATSL